MEQGHSHGNAKKRLRQGGVGRGNCWRKIEQDRKPAEDPRCDHRAKRSECQDPQPAALLHSPSPDCEDKREKPGYLRDHAMDVLKPHSTHQLRNLVPGAERRWPVRYGQSGVIAGYQRASDEEQKSPAGKGHRKPMVPLVIRSGDELQNVLLGTSLSIAPLQNWRVARSCTTLYLEIGVSSGREIAHIPP